MSIGIVDVTGGLLEGIAGQSGVTAFRGVPFAAPPVGDLRWRAPQPVQPWEGVRKADAFSAICPQEELEPGHFWYEEYFHTPKPQSEDCLYLNIWTPAQSPEKKLPVYLYIHGGGMTYGYGSEIPIDGENMAQKGIVVVTFNYRLNIFGYLAHPELSAESERRISGNWGMLDQVAALQWVHDNIAAFGGDPGRVTLGGQSAGSRSLATHLVSPLTKGLFHGAIGESGSATGAMGLDVTLAESEKAGIRLVEAMGYGGIAEMRRVSDLVLYQKFEETLKAKGGGFYSCAPVIDGYFMTDEPARIMLSGGQHRVPLLNGSTTHESVVGLIGTGNFSPQKYREDIMKRYGDSADECLAAYPAETEADVLFAANAHRSDHYFVGHRAMSYIHSKTSDQDVYQYLFAKVPPGRKPELYGAFHTAELAYVFRNLDDIDRPWTQDDWDFSDMISDYWINFIKTGDPNGDALARWDKLTGPDDPVMILGDETGMAPVPYAGRMTFLAKCFKQWLGDDTRKTKLVI